MADCEFTVLNLVDSLKQGKISVQDFLENLIERVRGVDQEIHSLSEFRPAYILNQAKALDRIKRDGEPIGKLFGVPISISDNIATADFFTEFGSKIYKGQQLSKDSSVVKRLRNENAVIFGKTNLTEFSDSKPSKTLNPHDKATTPGGSAAGAAASVAAGIVPFSIASQTNGSIIRSASYCGVYGFKPTNDIIPKTGLKIKSETLDSIGFFSRSIEDVGYVLDIVAGSDGFDLKTAESCSRNYLDILLENPPFDPKFLYAKTPSLKKLNSSSKRTIKDFLKIVKSHTTVVDLPDLVLSSEHLHKTIYEVELSFNLSSEYEKYKPLLSSGIKKKIRNGRKISGHDYLKALKTREDIKFAFQDFFEHFDAILTPSTIDSAPSIKEKNTGDPCLSTIWSLCGFPMISLPLLKLDNSMPYGTQLIGAPNDDARLLRTARWLVNNFGQIK